MRIYFMSCAPAILKLNGVYAGGVDLFERYVELELKDNVFAEIVPADNLLPVGFFIDEKLLSAPPDFLDVYLSDDGALVFVRRFGERDMRLKIICQTRFQGNLVTVFSQGEVYISVEGARYSLITAGNKFKEVRTEEKSISGYPVLAIWGGENLILISHTGAQIFANEVLFAEFGATFKTGVKFSTCTAAEAHCEYSYDGNQLTLVSGTTEETQPADQSVMHFAFFESVLTSGDCKKYLSPELAPRAAELKEYLGGFTGVAVPFAPFYEKHPEAVAAGLVYPERENLFTIKYFAVQFKDGKIDNIYPIEQ